MAAQVLQRVDDVARAAVAAAPCYRIDRPILAATEELAVPLRVGGAPDEQNSRNVGPARVLRQDHLLENTAVFGIQLRRQAKRATSRQL